MRRRDLVDITFLVAFWGIAGARGFDAFGVIIAGAWTLRVIVFERKGYRLVTRGKNRLPSKDPAEY